MNVRDDPRAAYWNQTYKEYWKERVRASEVGDSTTRQNGDARTEGIWVYEKIFKDFPFKSGNVLDVGCAWGRMFPIYRSVGLDVSGIDISESMIDAAYESYKDDSGISKLVVATAENLPFSDATFDNLVCVAVFDATYQNQAMSEFLRVLKPGGRLYVTGKSDSYASDDELAMAAEIGARSKGHPNYFTDLAKMRAALIEVGCHEVELCVFARRGDFAEFKSSHTLTTPFYEWLLILDAPKNDRTEFSFDSFASEHSRTFLNREMDNS